MKKVYLSRKNFVKFDDEHFLLYIGEQKVENYHPETSGTSDTEAEASDSEGITAFSYDGDEADGSTKIQAKSATYDDFTAGCTHQIQPESGRGNLSQSRRWR